jgi:hypothetical protein
MEDARIFASQRDHATESANAQLDSFSAIKATKLASLKQSAISNVDLANALRQIKCVMEMLIVQTSLTRTVRILRAAWINLNAMMGSALKDI